MPDPSTYGSLRSFSATRVAPTTGPFRSGLEQQVHSRREPNSFGIVDRACVVVDTRPEARICAIGEQNLHCFKITLDDGVMTGGPVVHAALSRIGAVFEQ